MIRIATRGSALALAQARLVAEMLGGAELVSVSSDGGAGDKARFVRGVEAALLAGEADLGVHSAKDLPASMTEGLAIAAVPAREDPVDVWVGDGRSLAEVPVGAVVGTASLRRRAQLLAVRPDLRMRELRGNVDTRLARLAEGELDGIVLAAAGLRRLGREDEASFALGGETFVPAAGQGALVVQARSEDETAVAAVAGLVDDAALGELTAERAVVGALGATCDTPIGVHARARDGQLTLEAFLGLPDGSEWLTDRLGASAESPAEAGKALAERLLGAGARDLLARAEAMT